MSDIRSKNTQYGFTIVELLIVIVVIAILAAISIVAYNGVQNRAEASKTSSAIGAYKKALQLYKIDEGVYPVTGAMCLGEDYPAFSGQSVPACRYSGSIIGAAGNSGARNLLKPYLGGTLPMPSIKTITSGSNDFIGGHFYGSAYNYTLDGNPVVTIEYYINGDTCPVGPVYNATAPNFTSPPVARSSSLGTGGSVSRCYVLLPQ